ncbi:MAG: Ferredoxin-1 [Candidatus Anoxychlamydiales bacterium]|nr:Ferredoxin-1 [Candidatus Anoxychlamydiales bacterium]NGX49216.1 Ferredoxin-1 [Candidatus Anoxychlamydiales bacterium]NGX52225.1 Ferredoxin-1 [Candidatus Anoxychlamydiales bacterium]
MAKLIFENTSEEVDIEDGKSIKDECEQAGIPFACSEGVCGSCIIEVVEGMDNFTEPTQAEKDFLGEIQTERLACQCKIKGGSVKIKF